MDQQFINQFKDLDKKAFASIYRQLATDVVRYVKKRGGDDELAQEIIQESMYRFFHRLRRGKSFTSDASVQAILFGFVKTVWREKIRNASKQQRKFIQIDSDDDWTGQKLSDEAASNMEFGAVEQGGIFQLVDQLGKGCKEVLIAFYVHNQSLKDIAEDLNLSNDYVKLKRFRCMKELRKKYKLKMG